MPNVELNRKGVKERSGKTLEQRNSHKHRKLAHRTADSPFL